MGETSRRIRKIVMGAAVIAAVALSGPGYSEPIIVDDLSRITGIDKITILPVVVVAEFPEGREEVLMDDVRKQLTLELALKGYTLKRAKSYARDREVTAAQVNDMSPEELASLGPKNASHILVLYVNAIETSNIFIAQSGKARLAAILIDKSTGEVLWKHEAHDKTTLAVWSVFDVGYIGMLIFKEDQLAIWNAFKKLFKSFPERPM